ncbi:hypothetical protein MiAbW_02642 [Microcystis aeruginosa NIES-4325]|uniref:Uncharacterized protein n=1 Tax=Microcystis aeruginosa NIES-4325 TaxID=2569534 RepID=A0A5J4FDQ8_MICAE|nr:hypothetical protein MiAbW_02642 [Microcystis aeruginosa NIES-4325]
MLGRIISANLKFILIAAKKAPKQVQSLIEQPHQQFLDTIFLDS